MKEDYLQHLLNMDKLCLGFEKYIKENFFVGDKGIQKDRVNFTASYFCYHPVYRKNFDIIKSIVEICDIFGIKYLEKNRQYLMTYIYFLEDPGKVVERTFFEEYIGRIRKRFDDVKDEIKEKISLLNSSEIDRLNEAIHCFLEGCYYSAIAMSVSAIEFRLLSLMTYGNPEAKLEHLTLGQLIKEYLENKEKYSNVIPKKHEPLLNHCNVYRVFSVHPKREEINKPIANSILNMTFMFLLDKDLAEKVGII